MNHSFTNPDFASCNGRTSTPKETHKKESGMYSSSPVSGPIYTIRTSTANLVVFFLFPFHSTPLFSFLSFLSPLPI